MTVKDQNIHRFIDRLEKFCPPQKEGEPPPQLTSEQRAALATLRRGLGRKPGEAPDMFRYIATALPSEAYRWHQTLENYLLIAGLFALHPKSTAEGNMGGHLAAMRSQDEDKTKALERRLTILLQTHIDDLPYHLRSVITWLKANEVSINWRQLLSDLNNWEQPDRYVQADWAKAFWGWQHDDAPNQT